MKSNKPLAYTQEPTQSTKPVTLPALEPLTRSEIDALRQKKREISAYYQKVLDEHFGMEEVQGT